MKIIIRSKYFPISHYISKIGCKRDFVLHNIKSDFYSASFSKPKSKMRTLKANSASIPMRNFMCCFIGNTLLPDCIRSRCG